MTSFAKRVFYIAGALLGVSLLSNACSYQFWTSDYSRPWREWHDSVEYFGLEFTSTWGDFFLESLRAIFALGAFAYLIGVSFNAESKALLSSYAPFRSKLRLIKRITACAYVLVATVVAWYHLDLGPKHLRGLVSENDNLSGLSEWNQYRAPYIYFLPYSLVKYFAIISIAAVLPTALWRDIRRTVQTRDRLLRYFGQPLVAEKSPEVVTDLFERYECRVGQALNKYSGPLLAITGLFWYESVANIALSPTGSNALIASYLVTGIGMASILSTVVSHNSLYNRVRGELRAMAAPAETRDGFEQKHNWRAFIHSVAANYIKFGLLVALWTSSVLMSLMAAPFSRAESQDTNQEQSRALSTSRVAAVRNVSTGSYGTDQR